MTAEESAHFDSALLAEVESAYTWLAEGAERVARGESAKVALEPGAWIWHLAKLAAKFAEKYPGWRRTPIPFPDPCGGLGEAGKKLVYLDKRKGEETARAEAARLAAEWWRMQGATGAMHEAYLTLYAVKLDGEARVLAAKADAAAARKEFEEEKRLRLEAVAVAEERKRLLDGAILEIADAKTRKKIQAKRTLKEQGLTRKDRDLQAVFHSIDEELKAQAKRGEKKNVSKAVRAVLSRPGCQRSMEDFDSVRRQYNRAKRRGRRKK